MIIMQSLTFLTFFSLLSTVLSASIPTHSHSVQSLSQFRAGVWIENVAIKDSNAVLVTDFAQSRVYQVSTPASGPGIATFVGDIPGVSNILGIVQTASLEYAVLGANFSTETDTVAPGSGGVFSLTFQSKQDISPTIRKIAALPGSPLPNGATALPITQSRTLVDYILLADSLGGNIVRVDLASGQATNVSSSPLYQGSDKSIGINGIKMDEASSQVYFTTTAIGFGRVAFDAATGAVTSEPQILLKNPVYTDQNGNTNITFDDFSLVPRPQEPNAVDAYLTTMTFNSILKASGPDFQKLEIFAGMPNSTTINQPTSTFYDPSIDAIYITTAGGLETPMDNSTLLGGQVLRVSLSKNQCQP